MDHACNKRCLPASPPLLPSFSVDSRRPRSISRCPFSFLSVSACACLCSCVSLCACVCECHCLHSCALACVCVCACARLLSVSVCVSTCTLIGTCVDACVCWRVPSCMLLLLQLMTVKTTDVRTASGARQAAHIPPPLDLRKHGHGGMRCGGPMVKESALSSLATRKLIWRQGLIWMEC